MTQGRTESMLGKEEMKVLRAKRQEWVSGASAKALEHKKALRSIRARLGEASATVPEIAEATGLPPDKALWLVATMKKFGEIAEAEKDGAFYRYTLTAHATQAEEE
jgi:DNA-binding IclR family transcriptional regulator